MLLQDNFIVWTQTELGYSIIAATIPSLRPLIKSLSTNYGTTPTSGYGSGAYGSRGQEDDTEGDKQQPDTYHLSNLRPKGKGDEYKYRIWSGGSKDPRAAKTDAASLGSSDSRRLIIKKSLKWQVEADSK
jgi:hypothetical protein